MYVKINRTLLHGERTYPEGSVVETDKDLAETWIARGVGEQHEGPGFEPADVRSEKTPNTPKGVETAKK